MSKGFRKIWKGFWNPIFHNPIIQWTLALILAGIIWFIYFTSKRHLETAEPLKKYRKKPVVFVFFHGRTLMLSPLIKSARIKSYCVTSKHKDGRMMARIQRLFGLRAIYGSTSDGGISVLREGVRVIRDKHSSMCISVDGPSGPSLRLQNGAMYFARMTGAPIVPCCFSCSRPIYLDRWDKYMVPKFFSKVSFRVGAPIYIDSKLHDEDFETKRKEIEEIMVKQLREMDQEFKLPTTEQDLNATDYKKRKHTK